MARALARMIVFSDNEAANELEVWLAGSTSAGSSRVNETMRSLGLTDSEMYGGYETRKPSAASADPDPRRESADFGVGKYTTACGSRTAGARRLSRAASARGRCSGSASARPRPATCCGCSRRHPTAASSTASSAAVSARGPLSCTRPAGCTAARHDNGVVAFWGGAYVATVLTWQTARADELAGRVSFAALQRFG